MFNNKPNTIVFASFFVSTVFPYQEVLPLKQKSQLGSNFYTSRLSLLEVGVAADVRCCLSQG